MLRKTTALNGIYNNYFNNSLNVRFGPGAGGNIWNNSPASGTNIAGGPSIGGNFWAKPDGTGFSQVCVENPF
ncbi:surface layer protein B [Methanosarcina horonobensis HB-1 = JCM 15518]|uniref:Surface layer protein B n=1 Tax=Methanosarcina horonobensis HB-1 = JCM 15518 TaxID=1434110 RepID=A0A0E3WTS9_9EURY|nr:NosD domain-containing protein [Methanosarcina horonobensis]AKB79210.1 surface layer protein B [Methanosarcina horonobensis HB-1 = JCM 15518]